jgi:cobalt-zinc-cadmium efflux system membrane fusion protein
MKFLNIFILGIIVLSCNSKTDTEPQEQNTEATSEQTTLSKIPMDESQLVLGKLSEINFGESLTVTGMIDVPPKNKSVISTFIGGYIVKTPLLIGDRVSKGQLLVTLENPEYVELQQNYLELSEQLNYLKSEYNRQKTLYDENISSEKNYLKAQSQYKSNLAHFNGLKKKLQMLSLNPERITSGNIVSTINLYAPIAGYVTKVNVSNGAFVSANDVIMEIVDTEHIHLELSVFEKDIMKVKKGQSIEFQIPEASNTIFEAEVHLVGTTIDESTRRVKVHGHVNNEEQHFIVGMYVTAKVLVTHDMGKGIPRSAVIQDDTGSYIYVLKELKGNNSYEKVKVSLGKQNENNVEILNAEGIKDKNIVIKGAKVLKVAI